MSLKKIFSLLALFVLFLLNNSMAQITEIGLASFYADKFDGRITASGEIFDQTKMTAAHRTLPFGTRVKVTNMVNKKSIEVVVNDRGPFVNDRVIDLSKAGATKLDFIRKGVVKVKVEVVNLAKNNNSSKAAITVASSSSKAEPKAKPQKKKKNTAPKTATVAASGTISSQALSYYQVETNEFSPSGYGIQIASYQEAANLMQRCEELKKDISKDVIVQVADSKGKKVYRVIIGTFSNKEDAEKYKRTLGHKYASSFILGF